MQNKRFILWTLFSCFFVIFLISGTNYITDPYGIYNHSLLNINKPKQSEKIRLIKAIKVNEIGPKSIVLGTSRAEYGYDPTHSYFIKPSYNLATSGSSMYENRLYFESALKLANLKKVLLVIDYRMLNGVAQKSILDFESYFNNPNIYKYLLSADSFKDSFLTLFSKKESSPYLQTGQRKHLYNWENISKNGGHLAVMNRDEANYYKDYSTNYTYKDTKKSSFDDFEKIIKLCYENSIELDIIFGPSHIRQWEALNYYVGYDKWLQWKKDVILSVEKLSNEYQKNPFRIFDFSVYHEFTAEKVPANIDEQMKYHWEASHYKHELGLIVLDRLIGKQEHLDFGVELDEKNIDNHIEKQKIDRHKFIDIQEYQAEIWNKTIK